MHYIFPLSPEKRMVQNNKKKKEACMGSRKKVNPDQTSDILGIPPYTWQTLIQRNDKILIFLYLF